jgi:hypothetical protein
MRAFVAIRRAVIDVRNPRPGKWLSRMSGGSLYNIRAAGSRPALHMLPATVRGLRSGQCSDDEYRHTFFPVVTMDV